MTLHRSLLPTLLALAGTSALAVPVTVQVRGPNGQPLAGAAVAVEVKGRTGKTTTAKAEIGQRERQFTPQLLVVQTGTSVSFPNFDTVRHHVYSFSPVRTFEIKLYAGTPAAPLVFDKAGTAVLGCNIHDRMTGFIHVVNTPFFAKTSASGVAQLDVPAGEHTVQVWHSALADMREPLRQALKVNSATQPPTTLTLPGTGVGSTPPGK